MGSVRKKGNRWYYSIEVPPIDGKRRRIERAGGKTKEEALRNLELAESDFEKYGYIENRNNILFSDYLDYWFTQYVEMNCSYNTQRLYSTHLKNHIKPALGFYKLNEVTPLILQEFLNIKKMEGLSKNTLDNLRRVLTGCFKYAVFPAQLIKENPARYIKVPQMRSRKKKQIITIEEFNKLVNCLKNRPARYAFFQTGWHTGMRSGEICALQWSDIDFKNNIIHVRHNALKRDGEIVLRSLKTESAYRDIAIGDILVNHLKEWKEKQEENRKIMHRIYNNSGFVFTRRDGTPFYNQDISKISANLRKKTGIDFNFHMLRHTHATMLLEAGANIKDIQDRLGHANISITMDIYTSTTQTLKSDTVKKFEELMADS